MRKIAAWSRLIFGVRCSRTALAIAPQRESLARHNPLAIPPVAILFGGIAAAGGLIQRRMGLPDAAVLVLQGMIFVMLLISETLYGRFKIFGSGKGA